MPTRRRQFYLRLTVVALLAGALPGCARNSAPLVTELEEPKEVFALGYLQPAGGVIAISGPPGDQLKKLDPDIKLNRLTPKNGFLGVMASYDTRRGQLNALEKKKDLAKSKHSLDQTLAEAQVTSAAAALAQAEAKLKQIELEKKRLSYLEKSAAIAKDDLKNLQELAAEDPDLVTEQQKRRQENRVEQAQKDFEIARDGYSSALAAAKSALTAAEANEEAAKASRDKLKELNPVPAIEAEIGLARQALAQSVLLAPNYNRAEFNPDDFEIVVDHEAEDQDRGDFTVLKIHLSEGETVTQLPVMQVGNLSEIVCVTEVYQANAKFIEEGQKATIHSNAFHKPFDTKGIEAVVQSVSQVVANPGLQPANPLAPVDRSVIEVRVKIDPENAAATAEASKWIGLQVSVSFQKED